MFIVRTISIRHSRSTTPNFNIVIEITLYFVEDNRISLRKSIPHIFHTLELFHCSGTAPGKRIQFTINFEL